MSMFIQIVSALCAVLGLVFLWIALSRIRQRRYFLGPAFALVGVGWLAAAAFVWFVGASLVTYQRLTAERPAMELQFQRVEPRRFTAVITYPSGATQRMEILGDEWQVDARLLKWQAPMNLIGFDSAYRLDRISGRYTDISSERVEKRSVHPLNPPSRVDAWDLARQYKDWLPWVDALYGSAAFLPMADGALFEVKVSQTGLVARPLNQAAKDVVGGWK
jgi:hypothetical protein